MEKGMEKGIEKGQRMLLLSFIKDIAEKRFESEGLRWFDRLPAEISLETLTRLYSEISRANDLRDLKV